MKNFIRLGWLPTATLILATNLSCQTVEEMARESSSPRRPVIIGSKIKPAPTVRTRERERKKPDREGDEWVTLRTWDFRFRDYADRNGDGVVDYEVDGYFPGTDGVDRYKEDNDFDGFYEREYEAGGYQFEIFSEKRIHEKVPQIHRVFPPTSTTKVRKSDL